VYITLNKEKHNSKFGDGAVRFSCPCSALYITSEKHEKGCRGKMAFIALRRVSKIL